MFKLELPIKGAKLTYGSGGISQGFGENHDYYKKEFDLEGHNGIDFWVPIGTPFKAAHDGEVIAIFDNSDSDLTRGFGCHVACDEGFSVYWHTLAPLNVTLGQDVKAGDLLGYTGNSGKSTGPHLHFAWYPRPRDNSNGYGGAVDPMPLFKLGLLTRLLSLTQQLFNLIKGRSQ